MELDLKESNHFTACQHKSHRVPKVPGNASLILPDCAGREDWLKARQWGIGGSEIAALIGANDDMTPFDVFRNKLEGSKDLSDIAAVEWGHRLEEAVALKTADELGLIIRPGGGLWQHSKFPRALVTPDYFAARKRSWKVEGLIECKTAGEEEKWADGSAPLNYQAQAQWQMGILGLRKCWLGCLVLGHARNFYVVEVDFDKEWFKEMMRAALKFWRDHIETEEPPMHDLSHPRTEALLKEVHKKAVRPSTELPEDAEDWQREYHEANAELKAAQQRMAEVKNWFRMQLEDAGAGYVGKAKICSYPEVNQKNVDMAKLRENYPEVAEACTVVSTYRRLTVSKPKPRKETQE